MDLTPSRAAVVAARPGHTPRPCTAMLAARSGVSLLSGGSAYLHHVNPQRAPSAPCVNDSSCALGRPIRPHRPHRVVSLGTPDLLLLLYLFGLPDH